MKKNILLSPETQKSLVIKSLYFIYYLAIGIYFTFINIFYHQIGLTGLQIGVINMASPLTGIFSSVLWGFINDRTGKTGRLLGIAAGGTALSVMLLSQMRDFWLILPVACLTSLFSSTIIPLLDNTTLSFLGEQRGHYGRYRLWGTLGFSITSFVAGPILEQVGLVYLFPTYAVFMVMILLMVAGLPTQPVRLTGAFFSGLNQIVRQPSWALFAAATFILWLASTGMSNFLGVTIKMMGGADRLVGITWSLGALTEIPLLFFSAVLLKKFGAVKMITFSFIFYTLRIALFGLMPTPEWAVAVNLLHGPSFGIFWMAAVSHSRELAPEHLKSTAQGLFVSVTNLSGMVGSLLAGWLLDLVGASGMFLILSGFSILAFFLFAAGSFPMLVSKMVQNKRKIV